MMRALLVKLIAANTHHVCYAGVAIAFVSLGAIGGRVPMDAFATAHFDGLASIVRAFIDGASTVALVVVWPAIIAAALGRPPTIPK